MSVSNSPIPNKEFIIQQLISEYERRSGVFHKAIDNYYVVLGIMFSALAALLYAAGATDDLLTIAAIPYVVLTFFFLDGQLRTTLFANSRYLMYLERRINDKVDYPLFLWESHLTPGQLFYYKPTRYMLLRAAAFASFVVLAIGTFVFAIDQFLDFLQPDETVHILGLAISGARAEAFYLLITFAIAAISLVSWLLIYTRLPNVYEEYIEDTSQKILSQVEV